MNVMETHTRLPGSRWYVIDGPFPVRKEREVRPTDRLPSVNYMFVDRRMERGDPEQRVPRGRGTGTNPVLASIGDSSRILFSCDARTRPTGFSVSSPAALDPNRYISGPCTSTPLSVMATGPRVRPLRTPQLCVTIASQLLVYLFVRSGIFVFHSFSYILLPLYPTSGPEIPESRDLR